jgi:hypothetical protein
MAEPEKEISERTKRAAIGFVAGGIVFQVVWLGWPALFISFALVVALKLWLTGRWKVDAKIRRWYLLGIGVFILHGTEEFLTGRQVSLPQLFGQTGTDPQYLAFNLVWFIVFVTAAASRNPANQLAGLVVLFFTVAVGLGNGVLHLLLVVWTGAYFPGAWTAPLCLAVGIVLIRLLYQPTSIEIENI